MKREQEEMRGGSNGVKWREVEDVGNRADEEAALCVLSLMPNLAHEGAVMRIGNRTLHCTYMSDKAALRVF